ncbi:PPC domain-containing protein [Lignipirellula cremea]|uniref:Peptidase C-terminal archaeal/bacterial domain-containing protein n=1 Tax=Lignipirellula cremea TaxID=2528010 RepID=A0A518DNE5_9BACT|nr:PPC domain-containing protein [Lignipirellula cremea]QDU93351.1 hypothetical protein Pla8534_11310 [Lignipirellula cremea]
MFARVSLVLLFAGASLASPAMAQQLSYPRHALLAFYPAGAQAGTTVELKITEQNDLEYADALRFSHPGITAKPVLTEVDQFYPEPRPVPNQFQVTVAANVPPGVYEVRATGKYGVSNARRFVVSDLPETQETEPNNEQEKATVAAVPGVMNGLFGADYDYFQFTASKGQRLVLVCTAARIDSRGDPVIAVFDASGKELFRSQDGVGLDPIIDFTAPAAGDYFVLVHELTFASGGGANTSPYRLTIADRPWVDYVDPPIVSRSNPTKVTVYGSNLGGTKTDIMLRGRNLEKVETTITAPSDPKQWKLTPDVAAAPVEAALDYFVYRHGASGGQANPIRLAVSDSELQAEQEPNHDPAKPQELSLPANVIGYFEGSDRDGYSFEAKRLDSFWIEVESQRLGQPTDAAFVVQRLTQNAEGEWIAADVSTFDDQTTPATGVRLPLETNDPATLFVAPTDSRYRILVWDQFGSEGGARYPYRLVFRKPEPGFRAIAIPDMVQEQNQSRTYNVTTRTPTVRRGGGLEVMLAVWRTDGFVGPIEFQASGLPAGVTAEPVLLGPGETLGALLIQASPTAAGWDGEIQLTASAEIDGRKETRSVPALEVLYPAFRNDPPLSRLADSLYIGVEEEITHPALLEARQTEFRMARGGKIEAPFQLKKLDDKFTMNVPVTVLNLPSRVTRTDGSAAASGAEGKVVIDIPDTVLPGSYTLMLRGEVDYGFSRNAEVAEQLKADLERITAVAKEAADAYRAATADRTKADQSLVASRQKVGTAVAQANIKKQAQQTAEQQAKDAQTKADQAQATFAEAAKTVAAAMTEAQAAADDVKAALEQKLAQAKQAEIQAKAVAEAAQKDAEAKAKTAKEAADLAAAAVKEQTTSEEELAAAEKARVDAGDKEKKMQEESLQADRKKTEVNTASQAAVRGAASRNVKTPIYGPLLHLVVENYPGTVSLASDKLKIKAGEKATLQVTVKREFDWKEEVAFTFTPGAGISGWQFNNGKIPASKNEIELEFTIPASQAPGEYEGELLARTRFNNRSLDEKIPVHFTIEAAPESKP